MGTLSGIPVVAMDGVTLWVLLGFLGVGRASGGLLVSHRAGRGDGPQRDRQGEVQAGEGAWRGDRALWDFSPMPASSVSRASARSSTGTFSLCCLWGPSRASKVHLGGMRASLDRRRLSDSCALAGTGPAGRQDTRCGSVAEGTGRARARPALQSHKPSVRLQTGPSGMINTACAWSKQPWALSCGGRRGGENVQLSVCVRRRAVSLPSF